MTSVDLDRLTPADADGRSAWRGADVVRIRLGGAPVPTDVLGGLLSVEVRQQLGVPAQLELVFGGATAETAAALAERFGTTDVRVDVEGQRIPLFTGRAVGTSVWWDDLGTPWCAIRAFDELDALRGGRRNDTWEGIDAVDVLRALAGGVGLDVQSDHTAPTIPIVHQVAESDLAFVRRLLCDARLDLTVRGDTVHVVPVAGIGHPIRLTRGVDLFGIGIDRRFAEAATADVSGWDAADAAAVRIEGDDSTVGWATDDDAARRLAERLQSDAAVDRVVMSGTALGSTGVRPGTRLLIDGVGDRAEAECVVTVATHRVDAASGYVTEWSSERETGRPATAPPATVTLGIVTDVEDPDGRGRVLVELPAHGGLRSTWLPVVCPGATTDAGVVALPEVDSTVAVLGPVDRPAAGVVLGGLFGRRPLPGPPVAGGRPARTMVRTTGGLEVRLDDEAHTLVLDDGRGSRLELGPDRVHLHAGTALDIEAPGSRLRIRADQIDFERA